MSSTLHSSNKGVSVYPLAASVPMIVVAILLSFVDLTFLNDVIGKILDFGTIESMAVAFALGLVGIVVMAHQGVKAAHGGEETRSTVGHYILWILLGSAFVLIRLFSATIMQLDNSFGDVSLIKVLGMNVRQVDLVLAPLMFFLYIATGLMVKDGFKNLYLNPDYYSWREARKEAKRTRGIREDERRAKAQRRIAKLRSDAEKQMEKRKKEIEEARKARDTARVEGLISDAANGSYSNALAQYRAKEKEIKDIYRKISANIDFIKNIDKQEKEFELKVKPSLMSIVQASIRSTQNSIALSIRKKTGEDINNLREVIEKHNNSRDE